ncbi:MAG: hypothetical protein IPK70_04095 [Flavobacteriales bacterium]|jgi:hypothetical protein|nr:hypothetical protein [Flavobacteriales bacterium]
MKKTLLSFALLGLCSVASAQLSTRENQDTRYKFGGRPVAGDMALVFGLTLNNASFGDGSDSTARSISTWNRLSKGNLLTFKKFIQDDLAIRAGFRLARDSRSIKGEVDSTQFIPATLAEFEYKKSTREYMLVPGIEKHFSNSNIFDVYAGADLYLGFGRDRMVESYIFRDTDDNDVHTMTTPYTIVGLGGIVGFNVFVLDLPIALGVEYGWSAFWQLGNKTKHEVEQGTDSWEYYTVGGDPNTAGGANTQYSSVKQKYNTMDTNDQVRLVLNIYFN